MPDYQRYFDGLQQELLVKRDQIQSLIEHGNLKGIYFESIVRDLLRTFTPTKFTISSGMILAGDKSSKQIDILIYDETATPMFNTEEMVIMSPSGVQFIIEVKGQVTDVDAALSNLRTAREVHHQYHSSGLGVKPLGAVLFGFQINYSVSTFRRRCHDYSVRGIALSDSRGVIVPGQLYDFISHYLDTLESRGYWPREFLVQDGYLPPEE